MRSSQIRSSTLLLVVLLLAVPAVAAEGGSEDPLNSPLGWVLKFVNFGILAGGAWYLLRRSAREFFRARAEAIVASITEAGIAKEDAGRRLREAEEKLANIERETEELRKVARHEASAEAMRIRQGGEEEVEKIQRAAQAEMEAAARAARMELKAAAARMAAERAEDLLYQQVTPDVKMRLVQGFVAQLSRSLP